MIETIKLGRLKWLNVKNPADEDLETIENTYHFHPLDIEDCRESNQRSKIDTYDDYHFLVLHFPNFDKQDQFIKPKEVKIFWGEEFFITIGKSHWAVDSVFDDAMKQYKRGEDFEIGTSDAILYAVLEKLMNESIYLLRKVGLELELINRELFDKSPAKIIERLSITRKNIIVLNTMLKPQLRVFNKFESGSVQGFADNMEDYWGNILDYYNRMWDMTEDYGELIEGLSTTFDSLQTNKTNEIMKILTLISSIVLPLTLLTGIYGMNVLLPLGNKDHAFWIIGIVMLGIGGGMIALFKKKKWM